MIDIYKEFGVDVLRDSENAGPIGAEMRMAEEIKRLRYLHKKMKDMGVDNVWKARSEVAFELAELREEITRLRARVEVLREPLAVYVHAHQTGNSVPPHIEAAARAALEVKP
jgi:uncharacterized coiled-coil protein SlyX